MGKKSTEGSEYFSKALYPILAVNFVGSLGYSIVLPILIFLVTKLGGNAVVYGLIGAAYSFFQMLGAPILGRMSDHYGRRRILLLSQVGTLVSWAVFLIAFWLPVKPIFDVNSGTFGIFSLTLPLIVLLFARSLDGLTGGNVSIANAYLSDISNDSNRSENFGKMAITSNLGFVLGPALASALGSTPAGEILPVLGALLISLIASLMIAIWLPESEVCQLSSDPEQANIRKVLGQDHIHCFNITKPSELPITAILSRPTVNLLLTLYFLVFLAFNLFYVCFPVYAASGLHWKLERVGIFLSYMSLLMAIVQGPALKWSSHLLSERALALIGSIILAASFLCFNSIHEIILYIGATLLALGNGLMWPSILTMLSESVSRDAEGTIQGLANSTAAMASIIGLLMGGFLYTSLNSSVFVISAALTLATFILTFAIPRNRENPIQ